MGLKSSKVKPIPTPELFGPQIPSISLHLEPISMQIQDEIDYVVPFGDYYPLLPPHSAPPVLYDSIPETDARPNRDAMGDSRNTSNYFSMTPSGSNQQLSRNDSTSPEMSANLPLMDSVLVPIIEHYSTNIEGEQADNLYFPPPPHSAPPEVPDLRHDLPEGEDDSYLYQPSTSTGFYGNSSMSWSNLIRQNGKTLTSDSDTSGGSDYTSHGTSRVWEMVGRVADPYGPSTSKRQFSSDRENHFMHHYSNKHFLTVDNYLTQSEQSKIGTKSSSTSNLNVPTRPVPPFRAEMLAAYQRQLALIKRITRSRMDTPHQITEQIIDNINENQKFVRVHIETSRQQLALLFNRSSSTPESLDN